MQQDERLRHSSSFGAAAAAYAEHRPDYAPAAAGWALELAPGRRVLDLGTGTGKLTATLAGTGAEVVAVEPEGVAAARFGSPEQAEFAHGQRRTADSLVETLATRAGMLVMPEQERQARLGRIRAYLVSRPETAEGEFTLPMLTAVLRVRRL